jgi:hypothetical protein
MPQPNFFDQFDQPAQLAKLTPGQQAAPNFFDQFDAPQETAQLPTETPERAALQAELDQRIVAADSAGAKLKTAEFLGEGVARPILRASTDLADGAIALPLLAASAPVAGYNALTGKNVPLPIGASVADAADGVNRLFGARADSKSILAPKNDSEQLATTVTKGVGGVLGGLGIGGALGATAGGGATVANVGRTLAANPGLQTAGAVTGGGSSELARRGGFGAVGQTVAGILGSLVPSTSLQSTVRTANKVAQGFTRTPEAQRLLDAGVDLTPGQMNPKGGYNQLEENAQSLGVGIGPVVRGARENARATFQRAAAEAGSAPGSNIKQAAPAEMLDEAYESFRPLYDQAKGFPVSPKIINTNGPDVPLDRAFGAAVANRNSLATDAQRKSVADFLDQQLTRRSASSDDILEIRHSVRAKARQLRSSQRGDEAELLDDADAALTQVLESQLPPKPLQALKVADSKYGDYKTLEKAVDRGSTKPDGFTAFDLSQSAKQANRGELLGPYARGGGGPLRELADDALKSMEVRSPANGQRILGLLGSYGLFPGVLAASGTQTGRRIAQGVTPTQRALGRVLSSQLDESSTGWGGLQGQVAKLSNRAAGAAQRAIADPYNEQLSLALQQAIELQKRRDSQGKR